MRVKCFTMLGLLKFLGHIPLAYGFIGLLFLRKHPSMKTTLFGLTFPNPVGLGGSFDSKGEIYNMMDNLGYGFVELSNPSVDCLKGKRHDIIIASDIHLPNGMNIPECIRQCERQMALLYDFSDMFVIDLRDPVSEFGEPDHFSELINALLDLRVYYDTTKPMLIKVCGNTPVSSFDEIITRAAKAGIDGVVTANINLVRRIKDLTNGSLEVIGSDVSSPEEAKHMIEAGASLIEVGDALFKSSPSITKRILKHIKEN